MVYLASRTFTSLKKNNMMPSRTPSWAPRDYDFISFDRINSMESDEVSPANRTSLSHIIPRLEIWETSRQPSSIYSEYIYNDDREKTADPIMGAEPEHATSALVSWDGPSDPRNPQNWGKQHKDALVITVSLLTFIVSFSSSIFSSVIEVTATKFQVSEEVMILGGSFYVLGFALGPLVWAPLSEAYGRRRPLLAGMALFLVLQIPLSVAENVAGLLLCRFLAGTFGSAAIAVPNGMVADAWTPAERGPVTGLFLSAVFSGPCLGPIAGAYILTWPVAQSWRWTAWLVLILGMCFFGLGLHFIPETSEAILLQRKAARLRLETKNWALHSKLDENPPTWEALKTRYMTKPLRMFMKEPILVFISIYTSLVYGFLYLAFFALPYSFVAGRNWSLQHATLPFLAVLIGIFLAIIALGIFNKTWWQQRYFARKALLPEDRFPPMIFGGMVLPIGLFWFAWSVESDVHFIIPCLGLVPVGLGVMLVYMSAVTYLIDVYQLHTNSAAAMAAFCRAIVAAGFPLFSLKMYRYLGIAWATSLMGFLCLALIPVAIGFWLYGKRIRSWSKYSFDC